ncbi:hypothetical protein TNCV_2683201 [Trichonephila clavipes]|nr:hypothetical protein TNCV_2683201 [Trichonephila clavipes]
MFLAGHPSQDVSAFSRIALHATFSIKLLFIPLISLLVLYSKSALFISNKITHGKRRCLTLKEALEYFHEIDDDDISESSSTEDKESSDFVLIPPYLDELTDEEDFDENVLGENLEIPGTHNRKDYVEEICKWLEMKHDCALRIARRGCLTSFSVKYKTGNQSLFEYDDSFTKEELR